ncbi:MAG: hypothetical protein UIC64_06880 [Agathobacter sp.]|nr:hypothetical protein [Agathobacter sp.]
MKNRKSMIWYRLFLGTILVLCIVFGIWYGYQAYKGEQIPRDGILVEEESAWI